MSLAALLGYGCDNCGSMAICVDHAVDKTPLLACHACLTSRPLLVKEYEAIKYAVSKCGWAPDYTLPEEMQREYVFRHYKEKDWLIEATDKLYDQMLGMLNEKNEIQLEAEYVV